MNATPYTTPLSDTIFRPLDTANKSLLSAYSCRMGLLRSLGLLLLLLLIHMLPLRATLDSTTSTSDSLRVSLLTCAPGHQIWRLYGHTALRIEQGEDRRNDWTYNYGLFSFDTPNFMLKFMLGLTDYSMGQQHTPLFLATYFQDEMPVTQQVLNLTPQQAAHAQHALREILESEGFEQRPTIVGSAIGEADTLMSLVPHWSYRYNFLYDNCTTRAVEVIRKAIESTGEKLVYPRLRHAQQRLTQREMIHQFTHKSRWHEFGQDLLLGAEVDQPHTIQELTTLNFLPTYAQNFFEQAEIESPDGKLRPLVLSSNPLLPLTPQPQVSGFPFTPTQVFWAVFALILLLTWGERAARQPTPQAQRAWHIWMRSLDTVLLLSMGLVGTLITFMLFWSEHPAVGSNWLILLFHPLLFLWFPSLRWFRQHPLRNPLLWTTWVGLGGYFVILISGIQSFPAATVPIALSLLLRTAVAHLKCRSL